MLGEGLKLRGHEYHYSELTKSPPPAIKRAFKLGPGGSGSPDGDGYLYKNTLAAYTHLHFASNIDFARGFIERCSGLKSAAIKT
jgi:cobyrinic acid a,c-diamide synthase